VSTLIGFASGGGATIGQLMAGLVGPTFGWRLPFIIVAIPAMSLGFVVLFTGEEPARGRQETHSSKNQNNYSPLVEMKSNEKSNTADLFSRCHVNEGSIDKSSGYHFSQSNDEVIISDNLEYKERINCAKLGQLFKTFSVMLILIQGIPGCVPWGMLMVFMNDYFSNEGGLTVQKATTILTIFSVGTLVGQLFGGWIGQWLYNRDPRLQIVLMGSTTLVGIVPVLCMVNSQQSISQVGLCLLSFFAGFLVIINGPNVKSVLQVR
jgi:MFS family permease